MVTDDRKDSMQPCSLWRVPLFLVASTLLSACSATPPPKPPPPPIYTMNIVAAADVNPDAQNRPSPIVVRVYQLKDDAAFKSADFFNLYDKEQATLTSALIAREEFELLPGQKHTSEFSPSPDVRFIGVAAGYRDIRSAAWRAISGAADKGAIDVVKNNQLTIAVGRAQVSFASAQ